MHDLLVNGKTLSDEESELFQLIQEALKLGVAAVHFGTHSIDPYGSNYV